MRAATDVYYGWWLLGAMFLSEMLAIGSTTYSYGLILKPLAADLAISRSSAGNGLLLMQLGLAAMGLLLGPLLDRISMRRVMLAGALAMSAGFALVALARSPWVMGLALLLLVCPGTIAIGPIAAQTLLARWFRRRRGRAMGLVTAATSMGGVIIAPAMAVSIGAFGWRGALGLQAGVILAVVLLLVACVIRSDPAELGLGDHEELAADAPAAESDAGANRWTRRSLLGSRNFWFLTFAIGLNLGVMNAIIGVTLVPLATDMGLSRLAAAMLMSCMSISGVFGKLVNGAISDYIDRRYLVVSAAIFAAVFLLILQSRPGYPLLLGAVCVAGLAIGSVMPVWGALTADCFGTRSYGTVLGFMGGCMLPIHLFTVRLSGLSFDRTGNYDLALRIFTVLALASGLLILLVRLPGRVPSFGRAAGAPA